MAPSRGVVGGRGTYGLRRPKLDQSVVVLQFVFEKVDVMCVGMEEKNVKT